MEEEMVKKTWKKSVKTEARGNMQIPLLITVSWKKLYSLMVSAEH